MRKNDKDFNEFILTEPVNPPKVLGENVFSIVNSDLNPSPWRVFSKVSFIHLIGAVLTLSVCPQFGFRTFGTGPGVMQVFMHLGHYGCMAACGVFFLGTSLLIAVLSLEIEEVKILRKHRLVQLSSLISMSLGSFIMIGASEILIGVAAAWAIGTFAGAFSALELGWILRRKSLI